MNEMALVAGLLAAVIHWLGQRGAAKLLGAPMRAVVLFAKPYAAAWRRALVLCAGTAANYAFAVVAIFIVLSCGGVRQATGRIVVDDVRRGAPADGKLQRGDRLISIDGEQVVAVAGENPVTEMLARKQGAPSRFVVERSGQRVEVEITPRSEDGRWLVGIAIGRETTRRKAGFTEGIGAAAVYPIEKAGLVLERVWQRLRGRDLGSGPIGITAYVTQPVQVGWIPLVGQLAFWSVVVGLFFIPIDAGRLVATLFRRGR